VEEYYQDAVIVCMVSSDMAMFIANIGFIAMIAKHSGEFYENEENGLLI